MTPKSSSARAARGLSPNILFILDTSGSMGTDVVTQVNYDPTQTYGGACDRTQIYFVQGGGGTPPNCGGASKFFPTTFLKCAAALSALGVTAGASGFYSDNLVQWKRSGTTVFTYAWTPTLATNTTTNTDVDCNGDYPATRPFPTTYNGPINSAATEFTNTPALSYWASGSATRRAYTIYSGNYLNWYNFDSTVTLGTRESIVQAAASNLINSMSNVNVGLMRYSDNNGGSNSDGGAAGGMVVYPVSPVEANRANLITTINSYQPDGWTPLSETLSEAYRYYSGGNVLYGNNSKDSNGNALLSVPGSRVGGAANGAQYQSPIQFSCQKNFIVYLTDGLPTQDNQADTYIQGLPNMATIGGQCDDTSQPPYSNLPGGWGSRRHCWSLSRRTVAVHVQWRHTHESSRRAERCQLLHRLWRRSRSRPGVRLPR